ncbi:hypothetical protein M9Y10_027610 [Tritrichomonas musculus]|uniref:Uncharacterized protein n=1 Tax=Tritrichomonas musculus TaxID=1915356 RepID=A0ABR2H3L6_9EUKA
MKIKQKNPLCVVGQNGCAKCDESLLLCLACEKEGYIVSGISCISPKCEVGKNNCTTCNENGSECQECIDPNYMITGIGCELNCSLINNCDKCYIDSNSGNQMKCNKCSNGFMPSDDYKSCVELNNCDIVGCLGCPANKTGFCYTCDTENHFIYDDSSNETYRKCICESGYELIQNKCIQKIEILPTPIVEEIKEKPDKFDTTDVNTGLQTINASDINNKNMSQKYVAELSPDAKSVEIQIPNNVNIEIVIPNTKSPNQPVIISAENDQTIVKINCKNDNGANLQLNNSASTEITGKGTITINPANTEETNNNQILEISKLIPSGEVNLASDKNVTFNELQVFDEKYVTGKAASENQIFKFNKVKIEQGGSLYPENLELHDIEIGVGAVLHYLDSCDFEKSDLTVYYNRTQSSQNPIIPILIESSSLPNSITARRKELGSFLEENEFIIAEANFGKQRNIKKVKDEANDENENVKKACEGWASKYKETDAQFNTVSCRYLPNEENIETIQLVASHKDKPKKKGLNGGAIAGIVIACVVVVAAIIALLVYFLVIKKHHESSSTAKDDSSIAI